MKLKVSQAKKIFQVDSGDEFTQFIFLVLLKQKVFSVYFPLIFCASS